MRILIVTSFLPFPADEGDPVRVNMFLSAVSSMPLTSVDIVTVLRPNSTSEDLEGFLAAHHKARIHSYPRHDRGHIGRVARALRHRVPVWVSDRFSTDAASFISSNINSYDLVVLMGEAAGIYAFSTGSGGNRVLWDKANVLAPSTAAAIIRAPSLKSWTRNVLNLPLAFSMERRALKRVTDVSVTSGVEGTRLIRWYRRRPRAIVPSAVPIPRFLGPDLTSKTVVWMSNLTYQPNWEGLLRFISAAGSIFGSGAMTLRIVGSGITEPKREVLSRYSFVDIWGFVPDLQDALGDVRCAVVPLWSGAGVKLKTITLMSYGIAVYSTSVGLEGLPDSEVLDPIDDPHELARRACFDDDSAVQMRASAGIKIVEDGFSTSSFHFDVSRLVSDIMEERHGA